MVNPRLVQLLPALLAMLLLGAASTAAEQPRASVDREELRIDETVTLTLSIRGQLSPVGPDLTPLSDSFDILSSRQSSRHRLINGRRESITEWHVELAPRRVGVVTIPGLEVADGRTEPLAVKVVPVSRQADRAENDRTVFIEAEIDRPQVHVQQQLLLTVRIFQAVELDDMNITEPSFDHASVRKVSQTRYQRQVGARSYRVHELVYAIYPQRPGELTIPELVFNARQPRGRRSMFDLSPGIPIRDLTPQMTVDVQAPPPAWSGADWLPARSVQLRERWRGDPAQLSEGESATRTIELVVDGQPAANLPELALQQPDGVRFYADQPERSDTDTARGIEGRLVQSVALVPTQPGEVLLPAVRVRWWNTDQQRIEVAELPERRFRVAPTTMPAGPAQPVLDPASVAPGQPHATTAAVWPWQAATALLTTLWLATLILWWASRRSPGNVLAGRGGGQRDTIFTESAAWKQLQRAARANDATATRNALLQWAMLRWPQQHFTRLEDVAAHVDHSALGSALQQLEEHLYGQKPTTAWRGQRLIEVLKLVRRKNTEAPQTDFGLPPLNP